MANRYKTATRSTSGDQIRDIRGAFAGGVQINWVGLGEFAALVKRLPDDIHLDKRLEALARDIQKYARDNAPWQDETGNARDGLTAEVQVNRAGEFSILLFHTEEYGVYLENANGGEYSVIIPTMEKFAGELDSRIFGPGTR